MLTRRKEGIAYPLFKRIFLIQKVMELCTVTKNFLIQNTVIRNGELNKVMNSWRTIS
jgi:hypothetical protein